VIGTVAHGIGECLPNVELTYVALEFGTHPLPKVLTALRADHWRATSPGAEESVRTEIRRIMRDAFYVDQPA